tara:strand:- start:2551 stop:3417 length:867 start_codon:yes stop_codon:yes gene_type:complete
MSEIEQAININKSIGDATKRSYNSNYKRLMKLTDNEPVLNMSQERLIKTIHNPSDNIPPHSVNALLSIILYIRKSKELSNDKLIKFRDTTLFQEKLAHKEMKNKKLEDELPSFENIEDYTKTLYKKEQYVPYIVNFLMLRFGVRNKDINLVITNNQEITFVGDKSKVNYLYVTKKYITYVRNDYKTHSTYGKQKHKIEKSQFTRAVKAVLGDDYEKPLLKLADGDSVSEDSVSKIIQRYTYNGLGEGKYFKIQIQELKKQGNIRRIRELAKNRGTDLETVFQEYDITK